MKPLSTQPNLVQQTCNAIMAEIAAGTLPPGERVVQERIAESLGISRQPVQQALVLLRNQGVLQEAPGRGLMVAPLNLDHVRQMYDLRAVLEGLAFREAALRGADKARRHGPALIDAGRRAVSAGSVPRMIAADMRLHAFIHEIAGNALIGPTLAPHLTQMQCVMGQVLRAAEKPRDIWQEHEDMLAAVADGKPEKAEALARAHILSASKFILSRLPSAVG